MMRIRALARILKLSIIIERVPIQNGLKLYEMVIFWLSKMEVAHQNDKMTDPG